jgi:hypothetical protein
MNYTLVLDKVQCGKVVGKNYNIKSKATKSVTNFFVTKKTVTEYFVTKLPKVSEIKFCDLTIKLSEWSLTHTV